jgi:hypothetical protein
MPNLMVEGIFLCQLYVVYYVIEFWFYESLVIGGRWSMVNGRCSMFDDQWSMVNGLWSIAYGQ